MNSRTLFIVPPMVLAAAIVHASMIPPVAPAQTTAKPPTLPEGAGKAVVEKVCLQCHAIFDVTRHPKTRREWVRVLGAMIDHGADLSDQNYETVLPYLSGNFGRPIKINNAKASEIAAAFDVSNEVADAIVKYRDEHGKFTDWKDLTKVPGVDATRIDEQKNILDFAGQP
jgi:competence ComEA-like helix-hairpin-helix protein